MNPPHILSCGEVLWDLFPEGARLGGAPANFACHAALLGGRSTLLSAVGSDPMGTEALTLLAGMGVETACIQRHPDAPTGTVGVLTDREGKPRYEIHAGSAWDHLVWSPETERAATTADAVYFGTLGQRSPVSRNTIRQALKVAGERGIPRILDVNLRAPFFDPALIRESLALCGVLKLSDEELPEVTAACGISLRGGPESALRALLQEFRLSLVAMTRGAQGALLVSPAGTVDQPGIPVTVRDTVGAGDSFTAALAIGLLRGDALPAIALSACRTASAVCAFDGAVPHSSPPGALRTGPSPSSTSLLTA